MLLNESCVKGFTLIKTCQWHIKANHLSAGTSVTRGTE